MSLQPKCRTKRAQPRPLVEDSRPGVEHVRERHPVVEEREHDRDVAALEDRGQGPRHHPEVPYRSNVGLEIRQRLGQSPLVVTFDRHPLAQVQLGRRPRVPVPPPAQDPTHRDGRGHFIHSRHPMVGGEDLHLDAALGKPLHNALARHFVAAEMVRRIQMDDGQYLHARPGSASAHATTTNATCALTAAPLSFGMPRAPVRRRCAR